MTPEQIKPSLSSPSSFALTVVVAAYNSERTIARAVQSALSDIEIRRIIIVDDASTDQTLRAVNDVIRSAGVGGSKVEIISLPTNQGPASARNRGIDHLLKVNDAFTHILFLDADDCLPANAGTTIRSVIQAHPETVILVGARDEFVAGASTEDQRQASMRHVAPPAQWSDQYLDNLSDIFEPAPFFGTSGMVVARCAFDEPHHLRFDPNLRVGEDRDLAYRAARNGKVFITPQTLVQVGIHSILSGRSGGNLTGPAHLRRWLDDHLYLVQKLESADPRHLEPMCRQTVWLVGHVCRELARQGKRLDAEEWGRVREFMHRRGWRIPARAVKWRSVCYWWYRIGRRTRGK